MPARIWADYNFGAQTIRKKPYWFAQSSRVEYPNVIAVNGASATTVATPQLDFTDNATRQFWMIYSPEEITAMVAAQDELTRTRLERLIAGSKAVAASPHTETTEGQDEAFLAVVTSIEQAKDYYNTAETEEAVQTLFDNLTAYLPAIALSDSIDISFVLDDAELTTGAGWEGLPELTNGLLRTTNTAVFTATAQTPVKMPKGKYGILARGFQRPGAAATAVKDFVGGKNNVKATITLNNKSLKLMHIAQGGADAKLNQGGTESIYSGIYVPANNTAFEAYFNAGRYDNLLAMEQSAAKVVTLGIKVTQKVDNDLLVIDGFKLFYYGNPTTGIEGLTTDTPTAEIEGYYNLNGMRMAQPGRGITIVRYKDGRSVKMRY